MRKLLQINITSNWGSTGKIAEAIGKTAIRHGWECYVAYGRYSNSSSLHTIKVGNFLSTICHYFKQRIFDAEGLGSVRATKLLISQIDNISPDVVHLHNIHDHYLNYKLLFSYLQSTNIHVVWTFHDCWAFTGHCMHFVTVGCDRWKTGCYDCLMRGNYPKSFVDNSKRNYALKRELFSTCEKLTVVSASQWLDNFVGESFLKGKRRLYIHNGIDLDVFRIKKSSKNKLFKILCISSVWTKAKGFDDVIKLRSILPLEKYEIIMVGLNKMQIKVLPNGIRGIERTQNVEELVDYYNEADVLLNTTYADTFPTVNLEALACGTPVITYNTGGSPEAIDSYTGAVICQGDIEGAARIIKSMKLSPLSKEDCRKRAEMYFDKNKCFEKYIDLYNDLFKSE